MFNRQLNNGSITLVILLFSLLLMSCGSGEKSLLNIGSNQIKILNASLDVSKVSIDVQKSDSVNLVLTRLFDDDSTSELKLVVSWDPSTDELVLKDDSGNIIAIEYDDDALLNGETSIQFFDPEFNQNVEFSIEFTPEVLEQLILDVTLSAENISLDASKQSSENITLVTTYNVGDSTEKQYTFTWSQGTNSLELRDETDAIVDISYDSFTVDQGSIDVTFYDSVSDTKFELNVTIKNDANSKTPELKSISIDGEKIRFDLRIENSADIILTRRYDDNSETKLDLLFRWDPEQAVLLLQDDADNDIALNYEKSSLLDGTVTLIRFVDPISQETVEFELELLKELDPPVRSIDTVFSNLEKLTIDLNQSNSANFSLTTRYNVGSDAEKIFYFFWLDESSRLVLRDDSGSEFDIRYDVAALNKASINVSFTDSVSGFEFLFNVKIIDISSAPDITIEKYVLSPKNTDLDIGGNTKLSVSIEMSDGSAGSVPAGISCRLKGESTVIAIMPDCSISAKQAGQATVTLFSAELLDESLVETATITVSETLSLQVAKVEILPLDMALFEGSSTQLMLTLTHSDSSITMNDFQTVKCTSSSTLISVTNQCEVLAKNAGTATIELVMLNGDTETELLGIPIEIVALSITALRLQPKNLIIQNGGTGLLSVLAEYNNGDFRDVTSQSSCVINNGADIVSISNNCDITGLKPGNAELFATLNDGEIIKESTLTSVSVVDVLVLNSGDYKKLDAEFFNVSPNTQIKCDSIFELTIDSNCEIFAITPGAFDVVTKISDATSGEVIGQVTTPVIVNALNLGNLSQTNEFNFNIAPDIEAIVYEISDVTPGETYKVTLSNDFLPAGIEMSVMPDLLFSTTCRNSLPLSATQVACGIKATEDTLFILLEGGDLLAGMSGSITVNPDADILDYAGPLKLTGNLESPYILLYDFEPVTVGTTLINGHVPANLDGPNVSRYFSSVNYGMDPSDAGENFYTVSVTFTSPNFDDESIVVQWSDIDVTIIPERLCLPILIAELPNTLSCTFDNTQQSYIFIDVRGNGAAQTTLSNISAVDGELSYSISLTQHR